MIRLNLTAWSGFVGCRVCDCQRVSGTKAHSRALIGRHPCSRSDHLSYRPTTGCGIFQRISWKRTRRSSWTSIEVCSIVNALTPVSDLYATVGALKDDLPEDEEIGEEPLEAQLVEEKLQISLQRAQPLPQSTMAAELVAAMVPQALPNFEYTRTRGCDSLPITNLPTAPLILP